MPKPPKPHQVDLTSKIDELGSLMDQVGELNDRIKEIREELAKANVEKAEGQQYIVKFTTTNKKTIDWKGISNTYELPLEAYTKTTSSTRMTVTKKSS